jgi:hypothetical protein
MAIDGESVEIFTTSALGGRELIKQDLEDGLRSADCLSARADSA